MITVQHIGRSESIERDLFCLALPDFTSKPDSLSLPTRHFVAFLAADASSVDTEILRKFARWLLDEGCVYFCAWGPGCERVHDIFDRECFEVEPVIMTTWHTEDSLDDALWFFINSASADDGYTGTCGSGLTISMGHSDWDEHIRKRLADLDAFNRDVLGDA
jgi:hypothetical protein